MGVETDFVLATPSQAQSVLASHNPAEDFDGVYAKGSDPISLGALLSVLTGDDAATSDECLEEYREVASQNGGEKFILAVPERLRTAFAGLPESRIPNIVNQWMETEDFSLTGWDQSIAEEFIRDLKSLLARSGTSGKELWMVMSV